MKNLRRKVLLYLRKNKDTIFIVYDTNFNFSPSKMKNMTIFATYLGYFSDEARKIEHNHHPRLQEDSNAFLLRRGRNGGEQQRHLPNTEALLSCEDEKLRSGLLHIGNRPNIHQHDQLQRIGEQCHAVTTRMRAEHQRHGLPESDLPRILPELRERDHLPMLGHLELIGGHDAYREPQRHGRRRAHDTHLHQEIIRLLQRHEQQIQERDHQATDRILPPRTLQRMHQGRFAGILSHPGDADFPKLLPTREPELQARALRLVLCGQTMHHAEIPFDGGEASRQKDSKRNHTRVPHPRVESVAQEHQHDNQTDLERT